MTLFGPEMNQTATIALASASGRDEDLNLSHGATEQIDIRWEPDSERVRGPDGQITDTKDVIYTEHEVDADTLIWTPDNDPNDPEDYVEPTNIEPSESLDGSDTLYKVVL